MSIEALKQRLIAAQAAIQLTEVVTINADDLLSEAYAHIDLALDCLAQAERADEDDAHERAMQVRA